MYLPGDSFAAALYTNYDTDRTNWEESAQAQVVDSKGYYKMDHGFKNNKKMGNAPGQPASVATLTCMTSEGKVAFQLDTASTSMKDVTPAIVHLQNRTRKWDAPVRVARVTRWHCTIVLLSESSAFDEFGLLCHGNCVVQPYL
jgi:hypothetical protein